MSTSSTVYPSSLQTFLKIFVVTEDSDRCLFTKELYKIFSTFGPNFLSVLHLQHPKLE